MYTYKSPKQIFTFREFRLVFSGSQGLNTLEVPVSNLETVASLKETIQSEWPGVPAHMQILLYNKQILEDNCQMSKYNITDNSSVLCVCE